MPSAEVHVPAGVARVAEHIERQPRAVVWLICALLLLLVFAADAATGAQIAVSIFYLLPVGLAAWHLGWQPALLMVVSSGVAWLFADRLAGQVYDLPPVQYWNALVRTGFFFLVAYILTLLKQALHAERELARTDPLTALANRRCFTELCERELARAQRARTSVALAFLDVDGFKAVNDTRGHAAGDQLLREIGAALRGATREFDVVARMGGDEFALLLVDTTAAGARVVMERVVARLLHVTQAGDWRVGYSIGVVSAAAPALSLEALLHEADQVMYDVKRAGGRRIAYRDESAPSPPVEVARVPQTLQSLHPAGMR